MTSSPLDIKANRTGRKYSGKEMFARVGWGLASPLFRFSPRPLFGSQEIP
ncbi:MAG: hypothetical protein U9P36_00925 [Thermodesulfobacteriota bacterium]|nr:hypothetical protein [Thermodesulfobacteriota bacterium]